MSIGKNPRMDLTNSVYASLPFGHTSLYEKLLDIAADSHPGYNTWDEYIDTTLESNFDHFVDNILDDELRLKLEYIT